MNTQEKTYELSPEVRKDYVRPTIIFETEMETRAGSPLGIVDPLNLEP